jgi:hypothetical protein
LAGQYRLSVYAKPCLYLGLCFKIARLHQWSHWTNSVETLFLICGFLADSISALVWGIDSNDGSKPSFGARFLAMQVKYRQTVIQEISFAVRASVRLSYNGHKIR